MGKNGRPEKPGTEKNEKKPEEVARPIQIGQPKLRQIVIETDGNSIYLKKAEVVGNLEFVKILEELIELVAPDKPRVTRVRGLPQPPQQVG